MRDLLESTIAKVIFVILTIALAIIMFLFFIDPYVFYNRDIDEGNYNLNLETNYKMNLDYNFEKCLIMDDTVVSKSTDFIYDEEINMGDKSSIIFKPLSEGQTIIRFFEKNKFNSRYKVHNYHILITKNPYKIDTLKLKSLSTNELIEIKTNKLSIDGKILKKETKPVELTFGETYKVVGNNHIYQESSFKNNKLKFCNYYNDKEIDYGIILEDDDIIKVETISNGSFSYFSSIYGGINFDYNVKFDGCEFYNDLLLTYNKINNTNFTNIENDVLFGAAKKFATLKCNTVPKYLTEVIAENIIPNVTKIEVNYKNKITNGDCYIPSNIKELFLKSTKTITDSLSIHGKNDSDLNIIIDGPISLSSDKIDLFSKFEHLNIEIKDTKLLDAEVDDIYFGKTKNNIIYLKGTYGASAINDIKFFVLENNAPLVIEGGNGIDSYINGAGQDGGDGINALNIEITTTKKMFIKSGNGGNGEHASKNYTKMVPGSKGNDGFSGAPGGNSGLPIKANKLILYGSKEHSDDYGLNIISGNGGNGGNGSDAQNGSYGDYVYTKATIDGFDGGNGGNGGRGGSSLAGLELNLSLENYCSPINVKTGVAGKGGIFGKGGKGGAGKNQKWGFITIKKASNGQNGSAGISGPDGISFKVKDSSFNIIAGKINICD